MAFLESSNSDYMSSINYLYKNAALDRHVYNTKNPSKDGANQMPCSNSSLPPNAILRSIVNAR